MAEGRTNRGDRRGARGHRARGREAQSPRSSPSSTCPAGAADHRRVLAVLRFLASRAHDPHTHPRRRRTEVGAVGLGCMGMSGRTAPRDRDDDAVDRRHPPRARARRHPASTPPTPTGRSHQRGAASAARCAGRRDEAFLATKGGLIGELVRGRPTIRTQRPPRAPAAGDRRVAAAPADATTSTSTSCTASTRTSPSRRAGACWPRPSQAGKARAIGMSEATRRGARARARRSTPSRSLQSELSLWTRDALDDVLPWCAEHGAAFIPFAPLGRGFLTGTINASSFDDKDFRAANPRFTREALHANLAIVEQVKDVADHLDVTPARSRWPGRSRRASTSSRSRAPSGASTSRRTPRPRRSRCPPTTSRRSTTSRRRSATRY